jgi:hypothetical protein
VYSIITNNWTSLAIKLPTDVGSDGACTTWNDKVYVGGGYNDDYSANYNVLYTFTLSVAPPLVGTFIKLNGAMKQARGDYSMVAIAGVLYAFGGYQVSNSNDWFCTPLNTTEAYDIAKQVWAPAGAGFTMLISSAEKDDGVTIGDRLYIIGGEVKAKKVACAGPDIVPLKKVYSIDPRNPAEGWRTDMDLPEGRMRFAADALGGSAYIFGGQGALIDFDTLPVMYTTLKLTPGDAPSAAAALGPGPVAGIVIASLVAAVVLCACAAWRLTLRHRSPFGASKLAGSGDGV